MCQLLLFLKPAFIDNLEPGAEQCSPGDLFGLILNGVMVSVTTSLEDILNGLIDTVNSVKIFDQQIFSLEKICIPYLAGLPVEEQLKLCPAGGSDARAAMLGCDVSSSRPHEHCYYKRAQSVCVGSGDEAKNYKKLFEAPSQSTLESEFAAIVGDSFTSVPPAMSAAFQTIQSGTVNTAAQSICDDSLKASLTIDQLILSCFFAHIESFCPNQSDDDELETFINKAEFKLPKVVWDWGAAPPPPPPIALGAYDELVRSDPEGVEAVREFLLEAWPSLTYVASQSSGANVGRARSAERGYGPVYFVSRYAMSTAFLSTSHFKDADSLSARIVQARFSGHFRFACRAMVDYISDPTTSAAGSKGATSAFSNPPEYTSSWDRNILAIAAVLFSESLQKQTGAFTQPSVEAFWKDNCVDPTLERSAVPTATWSNDDGVYGERDVFAHEVPLSSFGPLRAFGSLRQLRDVATGGGGAGSTTFPEDFTLSLTQIADGHFRKDRDLRGQRSVQTLFRDVLCNPAYKYSLDEAIGDPPFSTRPQITDASSFRQPSFDMYVPNEQLGASAVFERPNKGCGTGIAPNGCYPQGRPNYVESSLYAWVYVTSSDDERVAPGFHRLAHLPVFTTEACEANAKQPCNSGRKDSDPLFSGDESTARNAYKAALKASRSSLGVSLTPGRRLFANQLNKLFRDGFQGLVTSANTVNQGNYVIVRVNNDKRDAQPTDYRTGLDALFATRCSDALKAHSQFKSDARVRCCDVDTCSPLFNYASFGAVCVAAPLVLDNTEDYTLSEELIARLTAASPPPRPPPSPQPPPPPSPPSPPPPPSPPVAITAADASALTLLAQRDFCDAVRPA